MQNIKNELSVSNVYKCFKFTTGSREDTFLRLLTIMSFVKKISLKAVYYCTCLKPQDLAILGSCDHK